MALRHLAVGYNKAFSLADDRCVENKNAWRCWLTFMSAAKVSLGLLLLTFHIGVAQNLNGLIVFMSDRDGNREIYAMNPDGSDVQRLTSNDAQDLQPAWSPDKSRIAFVSNRDGNFAIYVMNPDGSNQRRISTDEFAYHEYPAWSPDGRYLTYASDKTGSFDIYIVEVSGDNPHQLTSSDADETEPAWSPDGRQIAYLQQVEGVFEVFLVNTNGGTPQRLTQSSGGEYFSPRWSPDGSQLAYALTIYDRAGNSSEIYVRNMATGEERLLISRENSFVQGLSWSADGSTLVYQVQEIQAKWMIHRVSIDDGTFQVLTDQSYNSETPSWFTPQSSAVPLLTGGTQVEVFASQERNATGLSINRGQTITIAYVSGSWRAGPEPTWPMVGPDGDPQVASKNTFPVPRSRIMTLIGGIGNHSPFSVGEHHTFQSEMSGVLWFAANDDNFNDNVGSLMVQITIQDGELPPVDLTECPGLPAPIVGIGERARVTYTPGSKNNVRRQPGTEAQRITQIAPGVQFDIIKGPVCADGYRWWQIRLDDGTIGWTADGDRNERWIEPFG